MNVLCYEIPVSCDEKSYKRTTIPYFNVSKTGVLCKYLVLALKTTPELFLYLRHQEYFTSQLNLMATESYIFS